MSSVPCDRSVTGDPVVALRRVDLHAEVGVVDADPAIAAAGDPGHVRDHAPLEVARRELHRRLLGGVELRERALVDALPATELAQRLAGRGQVLRGRGHLLGVDRVLLDARPGVGLVVARPVELLLGVRDLDLEALAGSRLLGDRPERLERGRLLLDLERRGVAAGRQHVELLVAHEARQVRPALLDLGDVRLLQPEPLLGLGEGRQPEPQQEVVVLGLRLAQLLLELGPAAQPAVHLAVLQLLVGRRRPAQPPADDREHEADQRDGAAQDDREDAEVDDVAEAGAGS